MVQITAIRPRKGRQKRVALFLDGKFAFSLEPEVALSEGLKVGHGLSSNQIEDLLKTNRFRRCIDAAYHFLSYRPRSEDEVRNRLGRRGFDDESIEAVIGRLKEEGLIEDLAFARFWRENRQTFSPRSRRLTGLELKAKGVQLEVIDQVLGGLDDEDSAYRAASVKAGRLKTDDYQTFRKRLGAYLSRRGFGYGVINSVVRRLWQENQDLSIDGGKRHDDGEDGTTY